MAAGTTTALKLISRALRNLNVLQQGEVPDDQEAQDGLDTLNEMIDSWSVDRLMLYTIERRLFTLISGQYVYRFGTGGDFDGARPIKIENAGVIIPNGTQPIELPLDMLNKDQYAVIPVKNTPSTYPTALYPDGSFPFNNCNFWPVPTTTPQVALYCWDQLTQFDALETELVFPPAYGRALLACLTVELSAGGFGGLLTPTHIAMAAESKAAVKSLNLPELLMACDPALINPELGQYNWMTDTPAGKTS